MASTTTRPSGSMNSTMPALPVPRQGDWSNSFYVLATTRALIVIGLAYLLKSLYSLVPSVWGMRSAAVAAAVEDGIGLENIISDTPLTLPGTGGTGPDLEANLALELRTPPASHNRLGRAEGSRFNTRAQDESTEASASSNTSYTAPEQDVGVPNGDPHTAEEEDDDEEEDVDIAIDLTG